MGNRERIKKPNKENVEGSAQLGFFKGITVKISGKGGWTEEKVIFFMQYIWCRDGLTSNSAALTFNWTFQKVKWAWGSGEHRKCPNHILMSSYPCIGNAIPVPKSQDVLTYLGIDKLLNNHICFCCQRLSEMWSLDFQSRGKALNTKWVEQSYSQTRKA